MGSARDTPVRPGRVEAWSRSNATFTPPRQIQGSAVQCAISCSAVDTETGSRVDMRAAGIERARCLGRIPDESSCDQLRCPSPYDTIRHGLLGRLSEHSICSGEGTLDHEN
jgi:hypothetical protein